MAEYQRPETTEDVEQSFEQIKPYMNPTMAYYESSRCLYCYDAPCIQACPTGIDIPLFIRQIHTDNITGAARTIYDSNYFGNICGKVCPTEVLCEGACVYNHQEVKPIEIGRLQSFATSEVIKRKQKLYELPPLNGKKVAIVGAGPAGISAACELRLLGYEAVLFEAKAHPSGLALYGCAPYKVTNEDILNEVQYLQEQFEFQIKYNHPIEEEKQLTELEQLYDAIFLGVGLGGTRGLELDEEELQNCWGATELIEQIKLDPLSVEMGQTVVVIGGGNTAMDAASETARLGAERVFIAYRRSKEEMGAYDFEYELAKSVGAKGIFNVTPIAIMGDRRVKTIRFIRTTIENGKVVHIPDTEFDRPCDMLILATGQSKLTTLLQKIKGLETDRGGKIKVDAKSGQTSHPKYFAGGDAVNGGAEVVNAAAEGKNAARGIDAFLSKN